MCRQVGWPPPKFSLCLTLVGLPRLPQGRLFNTNPTYSGSARNPPESGEADLQFCRKQSLTVCAKKTWEQSAKRGCQLSWLSGPWAAVAGTGHRLLPGSPSTQFSQDNWLRRLRHGLPLRVKLSGAMPIRERATRFSVCSTTGYADGVPANEHAWVRKRSKAGVGCFFWCTTR